MEAHTRVESSVVAPRNDPGSNVFGAAINDLEKIDKIASTAIEEMTGAAGTIRKNAADLVVAGAWMARIMEENPDAWDEFSTARFSAAQIKFKRKGVDWEFREIAELLFRQHVKEDEARPDLADRTISRSKISRYASAIIVALEWHRTDGNPLIKTNESGGQYLGDRIVEFGGVWRLAQYKSERDVKAKQEGADAIVKANAAAEQLRLQQFARTAVDASRSGPAEAPPENANTPVASSNDDFAQTFARAEASGVEKDVVIHDADGNPRTIQVSEAPLFGSAPTSIEPLAPARTNVIRVTIEIENPTRPSLHIVYPDGHHDLIPDQYASEVIERYVTEGKED